MPRTDYPKGQACRSTFCPGAALFLRKLSLQPLCRIDTIGGSVPAPERFEYLIGAVSNPLCTEVDQHEGKLMRMLRATNVLGIEIHVPNKALQLSQLDCYGQA